MCVCVCNDLEYVTTYRWEGIFTGSDLNNGEWHSVKMAVNDSHVLLAANDDVTIYPINPVQTINSSDTSFSTTVLGKLMNKNMWMNTLCIHSFSCSALELPLRVFLDRCIAGVGDIYLDMCVIKPRLAWYCVLYTENCMKYLWLQYEYKTFTIYSIRYIKPLDPVMCLKHCLYFAMHRWCNPYSQDPIQRSPILHWVHAGCRSGWICPGPQCCT